MGAAVVWEGRQDQLAWPALEGGVGGGNTWGTASFTAPASQLGIFPVPTYP